MTTFIRLLDASVDSKPELLLSAIRNARTGSSGIVFDRNADAFSPVPGSPFAYWVTERVTGLFESLPPLEVQGERAARQGGVNGSDERWLRLWCESPSPRSADGAVVNDVSIAKGGKFSRFYSDLPLVARWDAERNTFRGFTGLPHRPSLQPASFDFYFRPGLTWPRRTQSGFGLRVMSSGCIFSDKGPSVFVGDDSPPSLLALLAIMTSSAFCYLVELQVAFGSYEVGVIQRTPLPPFAPNDVTTLAELARRAWSLKRSLDTSNETSHAFLLPAALNPIDRDAVERKLATVQKKIDAEAFRLYGIGVDDRAVIESPEITATTEGGDISEPDEAADESGDPEDNDANDGGTFFSWLVGVAFGRFDPRLATGERAIPPEPEPFDPLPSRSPGMYPKGEEPSDRPDILVDDEGHPDDFPARAIAIAERVKVDAPENLRGWLAKDFFPLHIKMYSKSRRKAPIYWQLATPSASYSVWLYIHAFTKDTLFRVQNDYVVPKLAHEERRLEAMTHELREKASSAQRKELAAQEGLVDELRAFLEEVKRIAPLWNPNLDDGVVINFAPLWRLVPHHKPWQKELKATWNALVDEKYDWSHLAMHLWPERVVPKCATDRSFAIAHGLEDVFWIKGDDDKWTARMTPTRPIDELVRERTSTAVRAALQSLLEAPVATGNPARGRGKVAKANKGKR